MSHSLATIWCVLMAAEVHAAEPAIDRLANAALQSWNVPGVAIVIVKDGKPLHIQAYGIRELGKPDLLSTEDVFPLASCTKAFTAALAVRLGIADDPVRKHLPDYHLSDPNADALVTMRDLLTHRTGVNGHDLLWYQAPWNRAESLRKLSKLPLTQPFRGAFQYSTLQYMAVGQAAANAGRMPWEQLIRQHYTDRSPNGGFLRVRLQPAAAEGISSLELTLHDDRGEVLYRHPTP